MSALWVFLMLLPALMMLAVGGLFRFGAVYKINWAFGYRTARSMKNRVTWLFAHRYFGRRWLILGLILLPLAVVAVIIMFSLNLRPEVFVAVTSSVHLAAMLVPIYFTEKALKRIFDEQGNRRA